MLWKSKRPTIVHNARIQFTYLSTQGTEHTYNTQDLHFNFGKTQQYFSMRPNQATKDRDNAFLFLA